MNSSMHIAQECLNDEDPNDDSNGPHSMNSGGDKSTSNNLLGLEAFASTIDSILSRIKINLEQIQIRIENLDAGPAHHTSTKSDQFMSSSTIFNNRPSNGIALELRIKSIKYFDLDSVGATANSSANDASLNQTSSSMSSSSQPSNVVRNTTKSFNVEGLTIYFDEFVVRDDYDLNDLENINRPFNRVNQESTRKFEQQTSSSENSLNSTIDINDSANESLHSMNTLSSANGPTSSLTFNTASAAPSKPVDESAPFNFELNPDYYLYTNPIILVTFSGIVYFSISNSIRFFFLVLIAFKKIIIILFVV